MSEFKRTGLAEAWAEHLDQYRWDVWSTLTFRHDTVSLRTAWTRLTELCRALARDVCGAHLRVAFSCGPQRHRWRATPHFHLLVGPVDGAAASVPAAAVEALWRHGNVHFASDVASLPGKPRTLHLSGHEYVETAVVCPTKRCSSRRRCPIARSPWPSADALVSMNWGAAPS